MLKIFQLKLGRDNSTPHPSNPHPWLNFLLCPLSCLAPMLGVSLVATPLSPPSPKQTGAWTMVAQGQGGKNKKIEITNHVTAFGD